MKTPVALIIFKRPDTTKQVFEAIRQARPLKLFIIADGHRKDRPGEAEKCAATRAIIDRVDWDCEVFKNYSDVNMGCKQSVSSGLDWVFSIVEEAIILEDDCVPDSTFFRFCEELLEKYRYDRRVMMITGTNILSEWKSEIQSYHFSYFGSCWGWASWKRAWNHYDVKMELWSQPEIKNRIRDVIADRRQYLKCKEFFDAAYTDKANTWDYQWFYTRLSQSGLIITPAINLISNIGFNEEGTNTKKDTKGVSALATSPIHFPLKEPFGVAVDRDYDYLRYKKTWEDSWKKRIFKTIKLLIKRLIKRQ